ncbi:MAG: N-acetylmuramoyl-L-alanine amidase [Chitinispirillaceae bacterium]|nr:N-acetylmuramoyl-L-alanine amidase [Chitinispirillaceae bacterium]
MRKEKLQLIIKEILIILVGALLSNTSLTPLKTENESKDKKCSIAEFADSNGFSCSWERTLNRLSCTGQAEKLRFYEDNYFYYVNGEIKKLSFPPARMGASLYLPCQILNRLFKVIDTSLVPKGEEKAKLQSSPSTGANIIDVSYEKKQNGTLLTIILSDSLPFDYTYFYPNLTLNFFGGKIDTLKIRKKKRIGLIDSIFSIQFEKSAQVTALLNNKIEEPMVDYIVDSKSILVSLRPEKQKKKNSDKSMNKSDQIPSMVVVIDPGHGGKDPGTIGPSGTKEKDIVLSIALKLRDSLKKKNGIKVYMTREKDIFVPLIERTKFANDKNADLFISIHADAISDKKKKEDTRGYKVYFLSQAKNEEDRLVAMRENEVIKLEDKPQMYSNLQTILIEMASNEYLRESQEFCILLDEKFSKVLSSKIPKLHLGVGQANFWVLNGAYMPAVLIETGFLSHKEEEKLLTDKDTQEKIVAGISNAVIDFCKRYGFYYE